MMKTEMSNIGARVSVQNEALSPPGTSMKSNFVEIVQQTLKKTRTAN